MPDIDTTIFDRAVAALEDSTAVARQIAIEATDYRRAQEKRLSAVLSDGIAQTKAEADRAKTAAETASGAAIDANAAERRIAEALPVVTNAETVVTAMVSKTLGLASYAEQYADSAEQDAARATEAARSAQSAAETTEQASAEALRQIEYQTGDSVREVRREAQKAVSDVQDVKDSALTSERNAARSEAAAAQSEQVASKAAQDAVTLLSDTERELVGLRQDVADIERLRLSDHADFTASIAELTNTVNDALNKHFGPKEV